MENKASLFTENVRLKSTLDNILEFEEKLVEMLSSKNFEEKLIFEVRLAFHEAIVNVLVHTYKEDPNKDIDVMVKIDDRSIAISIRDYGNPVDISTIKSRDLDDLKEHGLGVHFYQTLMDKIEYSKPPDRNGNIIKMTKIL